MMGFSRCLSYVRDGFRVTVRNVLIFFVRILSITWCLLEFIGFVRTHFSSFTLRSEGLKFYIKFQCHQFYRTISVFLSVFLFILCYLSGKCTYSSLHVTFFLLDKLFSTNLFTYKCMFPYFNLEIDYGICFFWGVLHYFYICILDLGFLMTPFCLPLELL